MNNLKKLPFRFQQEYSGKCYSCETIKKEIITYNLQIKFIDGRDIYGKEKKTFLLYYEPQYYGYFEKNPEVIGNNLGQGEEDLDYLIKETQDKLKDLNII